MKLNAAYMILAAIGGASFNTLLWWSHIPDSKQGRARRRIAINFLKAAIPAPLFALGGQEAVYYFYPWTKDYPYSALLGSFFCGAASPFLFTAANRWLEQRVNRLTGDSAQRPSKAPDSSGESTE